MPLDIRFDTRLVMAMKRGRPQATPDAAAVRLNLTVPPDLREQMKAVEAATNWSEIASEAFRNHLRELKSEAKMNATAMDVAKRLRVVEEVEAKEAHQEGREAGIDWVKNAESVKDIRRLNSFEPDGSWRLYFDEVLLADRSIGEELFRIISRTRSAGAYFESEAREFWKGTLREECVQQIEDIDFAVGFVDGALAFWGEVQKNMAAIAAVERSLLGTWTVSVGTGTYEGEWEFHADGTVSQQDSMANGKPFDNATGKWEVDADKSRVLITWNNTNRTQDCFDMPIGPKGCWGSQVGRDEEKLHATKIS